MHKLMHKLFVCLMLFALPAAAQQCSDCPENPQNCVGFTAACSGCGLVVCGSNPDTAASTPQFNQCKLRTTFTCHVRRNPDNSLVVCGDANQANRCYGRSMQTSGYKCDGTGVLSSFTLDRCCKTQ